MGKGIKGQASPLSFAALGSCAFGDGGEHAIMSHVRTPARKQTCQHLARVFELWPVVISGMGIPFLGGLFAVDPLSNKPRPCPRPPNLRQNAVLARQTVHVSLAVAVALHRPAAMAVAGAAKAARPRVHSRMQHPFPADQEMPCLPV